MATGGADQQIILEFVLRTQAAKNELEEFRKRVHTIKTQMQELRKSSGEDLDSIAKSMKNAFAAANIDEGGSARIQQYNQALSTATKEAKAAEKSFISLGNVAKYAFFTILGGIAIGSLKKVIGFLKQSAQAAIDFTQVLFKFEVAIRGLQRVGLDTTLKEWRDFMKDLKAQFPIFSQADITNAVAQAALLEREFGLTTNQIQDLAKNAAVLAEVVGIELTDSVTNITQFLNTGYSRALRNAGLSTSKAATEQKAMELGINKTVEEMTDEERVASRLALVIDGLAAIAEDAGRIMDTAAGRYAKASADLIDANIEIGESVMGLATAWKELEALIITKVLVRAINAAKIYAATLYAVLRGAQYFVETMTKVWTTNITEWDMSLEDFGKGFTKAMTKGLVEGARLFGALQEDILGNFGKGIQRTYVDYEKVFGPFQELLEKLLEIENDYSIDLREAEEDLQNDLADIDEKGAEKREDIWRDFYDDLADIARDAEQDVQDANRELAQDIEDLNRETNQDIADANEKHREEEIKAERDFQEKLLRLREDFLLNLEDALRERDAKQVLRLIRRFNLEKTQLERERDNEQEDRDTAFENELEDIREQRERKLEELRIEHQRRLEEIRIQTAREREEAAINRERELRDLEIDLQRQRDERQETYVEQLADLKQSLQDRISELFTAYSNEHALTTEMAEAIRKKLAEEFGPGGNVESIYSYFVGMINNATAAAIQSIQQMQALAASATIGGVEGIEEFQLPPAPGPVPDFASGGTLFANKPTLARFGEVPEMVQFTPLSKLGRGGNPSAMMGGRAGVGGMARLEIFLSPGLEGSIIDSTLEETANMLMSVMNSR